MGFSNMARVASQHRDESLRHFTGKAANWVKTKTTNGCSLASASLRRCAALLGQWDARMRERAFLATLKDIELRDMGLSSTDRWREVNKPFWHAGCMLLRAVRRQPGDLGSAATVYQRGGWPPDDGYPDDPIAECSAYREDMPDDGLVVAVMVRNEMVGLFEANPLDHEITLSP